MDFEFIYIFKSEFKSNLYLYNLCFSEFFFILIHLFISIQISKIIKKIFANNYSFSEKFEFFQLVV